MKKFIVAIATIVVLCNPAGSKIEGRGPLFIQVHYSKMITGITSRQLNDILAGKINSFSWMGSSRDKMNIYTDENISSTIRREFPSLKTGSTGFSAACISGNREIIGDRNFLGISDSRGLTPCMKTLYIDNKLPWGKLEDDHTLADDGNYTFIANGAENWNKDKHLTIVQTGVTAMTRAFIRSVEKAGNIEYTVNETKNITGGADIAVTSNEVSFLDPCRYPFRDRMSFCSPLNYFDILKISGFDVIELTGNHNNDYGWKYNLSTINLIKQNGMKYFGGGKNTADAENILYMELKGIRIAFVGFNQWGPANAWASGTKPGAARLTRKKFEDNIRKAVSNSEITIVTVQWGNENNPVPHRAQVKYFQRAAELGADIMISSSAHRVMGLEFFSGKFISYGLGNFLFDQMQTLNHRRGVIARHHIYNGRHVETELIPYIIYNHSQPRLLDKRGSIPLWKTIFRYSLGPAFR